MKTQRVFQKSLNLFILLVSIITILCFLLVNFLNIELTCFDFLFSEDYAVYQDLFLTQICSDFQFVGTLFIYTLYAIFFIAIIDIILCSLMFIPAIRKNFFMALLYKTFLIFYGVIQSLLAIATIVFTVLYIIRCSNLEVNFFSIQDIQPILATIIIAFISLCLISTLKIMTYFKYKR